MSQGVENTSLSVLRDEVVALAPWWLNVEITPELSTRFFHGEPLVTSPLAFGAPRHQLVDPRDHFVKVMKRVYPRGLEGRRVLDCGCNCGGYLFWAKELGAGECFGFDAREHWINQARFLAKHRETAAPDVHFDVCDLYDLPKLGLEPFDIVIFYGIFYHLPDPVRGLKVAADLAKELLVVDSITMRGLPEGVLLAWERPEGSTAPVTPLYRHPGAIAPDEEHTTAMHGVYDLHWFPSGPTTLTRILKWTGFPETRSRWRHLRGQLPDRDRLEILATRAEGFFTAFDASATPIRQIIDAVVPSGATVLVASGGDEDLVELGERCGWHFPRAEDGSYARDHPTAPDGVVGQLEELRAAGAEYLVFPARELWWLDNERGFGRHLESRYTVVAREDGIGVVLALGSTGTAHAT